MTGRGPSCRGGWSGEEVRAEGHTTVVVTQKTRLPTEKTSFGCTSIKGRVQVSKAKVYAVKVSQGVWELALEVVSLERRETRGRDKFAPRTRERR